MDIQNVFAVTKHVAVHIFVQPLCTVLQIFLDSLGDYSISYLWPFR